MQHATVLPKTESGKHLPDAAKSVDRKSHSNYAVDEINAYIAIRDELLAEAEELKTHKKLDCVCIANDFVETCLKPARPPYEAQCLPEPDAVRERKRCEAVRIRIAELRKNASAVSVQLLLTTPSAARPSGSRG
jgi:hypothetical protein